MIPIVWAVVIALIAATLGMLGAAMCGASGQAERCARCELKQWLEDDRTATYTEAVKELDRR